MHTSNEEVDLRDAVLREDDTLHRYCKTFVVRSSDPILQRSPRYENASYFPIFVEYSRDNESSSPGSEQYRRSVAMNILRGVN